MTEVFSDENTMNWDNVYIETSNNDDRPVLFVFLTHTRTHTYTHTYTHTHTHTLFMYNACTLYTHTDSHT